MSRSLAVALTAVALLSVGCTNDFSPQSDLLGLRVLALVADPLELAPGQSVTIRPTTYVPPGSTLAAQGWTFCPISAGAVAAYACAVPQCEVEIPAAADGSVTANPTAILSACLGFTGGPIPASVPDQLLTVFRYRVATDAAATRDAVLQIPQWTRQPPPDPNLPPVILGVEIGGLPAVVGVPTPPLPVDGVLPVRLLIDPASVQTYLDAAGVSQTETMTGYFYTTAGTFKDGITTGTDTTTEMEGTGFLPGQTSAQVWVVALDLRGGQAVVGPFTVPLGP
ncbi:MAG: hypothetical protein H6Q88_3489 [Anaeromyxobacteraceae bacterium]|nr:hypothetical protein [Anaeromyxobacteraceae bacterium]